MVKAFAYKNSTVLLPNRLNEEEDEETAGKDDISEDSTDGEEENLGVYEFGNEDEFEEEDEFEDEKIAKVIQFDRDEDDFRLDDPLRVPCFVHGEAGKKVRRLLMFVSTRWGSWIPVIRRVLSIEDVIVRVAKTHKFAYPDQDEMDYLRNVLKILEPFEEIIIQVNQPSVSLFPIMKEEIPETSNAYILIDQLRVDLMCRFRYLLDPSVANFDSAFLVTTMSDVNTMDTLDPEEEQVGIDYLVKMLPRVYCQQRFTAYMNKQRTKKQGGARESTLSCSNRSLVLNLLEKLHRIPRLLNQEHDPIIILAALKDKSNGHLINLCISLLSVPATGSPVERVFSIAGMMVNKHRSRTEEELLDAKLIVYNNHITAFTN
uniref:HAT C-terminal dimerisation domain-containing protein n=1 Tax=Ditylenchus dipsaci TaxID=166011 RepID=A0A915ERK4_9BILA